MFLLFCNMIDKCNNFFMLYSTSYYFKTVSNKISLWWKHFDDIFRMRNVIYSKSIHLLAGKIFFLICRPVDPMFTAKDNFLSFVSIFEYEKINLRYDAILFFLCGRFRLKYPRNSYKCVTETIFLIWVH